MINISKTTSAYLAGFIDGEGTIAVRKGRIKNSTVYSVFVSVSNTNRDIIFWLYRSFGGTLWERQEIGNWKSVYRWTLYRNHNLVDFLKKIKPYLRQKRRHAEIVIEMDNLLGYSHKEYIRNESGHIIKQYVNDTVLKRREELYQEIKILNHRGSLHAERLSGVTPKGDALVRHS